MLIVSVALLVGFVACKPTLEGPCADAEDPMECLHGILMHGDENLGESHKAEDQYLRFKSELETRKDDFGPKDADETFHGVLMHGAEETGNHEHSGDLLPKDPPKAPGAQDLDDYIHGVLMHGDVEPGQDHAHEHRKLHKDPVRKGKIEPMDADKLMHGVLMHGDANADLNHAHGEKENDENRTDPFQPVDPDEAIHDSMHDGVKVDHSNEGLKHPKDISGKIAPSYDELHGILMHGDSEVGHDHEKDHAKNKVQPFKFDIEEIKNIVPEDILKTVDLKEIMKVDKEDYKKWKDEKKTNEDDDEFFLSSFPFVMDSILSNIDLMKNRYIKEDNAKVDEDKTKKNLEYTAEVIKNLDMDLSMSDHDGPDMTHELELIGSTAPISERHKHLKLRNNKERHEM